MVKTHSKSKLPKKETKIFQQSFVVSHSNLACALLSANYIGFSKRFSNTEISCSVIP